MVEESAHNLAAFAQTVKESLRKAEESTSGLRKANSRLLVTSIVSSAATALVAGGTALTGPVVGEGIPGWRFACTVAAILAFTSTVCTALTQQLRIGDRLTEGNQCVGRLRSLDLTIITGGRSWEEITKEYAEIAKTYPELI